MNWSEFHSDGGRIWRPKQGEDEEGPGWPLGGCCTYEQLIIPSLEIIHCLIIKFCLLPESPSFRTHDTKHASLQLLPVSEVLWRLLCCWSDDLNFASVIPSKRCFPSFLSDPHSSQRLLPLHPSFPNCPFYTFSALNKSNGKWV